MVSDLRVMLMSEVSVLDLSVCVCVCVWLLALRARGSGSRFAQEEKRDMACASRHHIS